MNLTREQLESLRFYAARSLKGSPWVVMPLEAAHLFQRLAGEAEWKHDASACRVDQKRIRSWIQAITVNHPELGQTLGSA